jgi:hypothetical protein
VRSYSIETIIFSNQAIRIIASYLLDGLPKFIPFTPFPNLWDGSGEEDTPEK